MRILIVASISLFLACSTCEAATQQFPPIPAASASTTQAWTGQIVTFSGAGSIDPDNAPSSMTYAWDLGDGTIAAGIAPTHAYADPGAYTATVTVSDGQSASVGSVTVVVLAPPTAVRPSATSPLALRPGEAELWVANPDSDTVTILSIAAGTLVVAAEVRVGDRPRTLAFARDGSCVWVACQGSGDIWQVDAATRRAQRRVVVGGEPYGICVSPADGTVLVTRLSGDALTVLSPGMVLLADIALPRQPRAIAIAADGTCALITHYLSRGAAGLVSVVHLGTRQITAVPLADDIGPDTPSSGKGIPNLLSAAVIEPSGLTAWVGGLKSNTGRGLTRDGHALNAENRVRGICAPIRLSPLAEWAARRIDPNDADSVSAIAFSPNGRYAYLAHQGAGTVSVYDVPMASQIVLGDGSTASFEDRIAVGEAPQGVVVSGDGTRAWLSCFLSRTVVALDCADPRHPTISATTVVTAESLRADIAEGKRAFYRSSAPKHSLRNYIACASCHADGGMSDGRTWDMTSVGEGLRNTTDLRGRGGMAHGPVHWSANFDEIQDFENDIVNSFGGTGLAQDGSPPNAPIGPPNAGRSRELDALAAYVTSLSEPPRSPARAADGSLSPSALRGKTLFERADVGCTSCHAPPRFTDSTLATSFVLHDVGTLSATSGSRLGTPLTGLDTPSLIGVWD
ncbi:MAG: beta-propeller fold lactonase family protein, partial [Planctomycetes bacterium]|nr:beta-propeller fold lactonase family protein [Planctomycetota bacterium]